MWKTAVSLFCVLLASLICSLSSRSQTEHSKQELFRRYVSLSQVPFAAAIPAKTCDTIITQANTIFTGADDQKLKDHLAFSAIPVDDLREASLNLRTCATLKLNDVPRYDRFERDLAVALYGDVISELDRRERAQAQ